MIKVYLKLESPVDVKNFVDITAKYPYDLDIRQGRHVVDGKSILGIFSLDLLKPLALEAKTDKCDDLIRELKPYIVQRDT